MLWAKAQRALTLSHFRFLKERMRSLWSGTLQGSAGEASTLKALPELCFVMRCAIFVLYQSGEEAHFLYLTEEVVLGLRQHH